MPSDILDFRGPNFQRRHQMSQLSVLEYQLSVLEYQLSVLEYQLSELGVAAFRDGVAAAIHASWRPSVEKLLEHAMN
ncbi:MAG: hypothetical protein P8L85_12865 [Rubripirellula sp.]|nr:hypothetical protein [Rubripirellula sp.]